MTKLLDCPICERKDQPVRNDAKFCRSNCRVKSWRDIKKIPVDHMQYALARLPAQDKVSGDVWKIEIPRPPNTREYRLSDAPVSNEEMKILVFVKEKESWALSYCKGY
jgi:hypothetical protein